MILTGPGAAKALAERFRARYGREPAMFRAPGRVNLIGEHTDYNDGFVMPAAIAYDTWVAAARRDDRTVTFESEHFEGTRSFDLDHLESGVRHDWSDYLRGMLVELQRNGSRIEGADMLIGSDVPIGAGLSSSASVCVATGYALLDLAALPIDRISLAKTAQRAENEHAGAKTGIMDQFVVANAEAGHALILDTRSLDFRQVPLPEAATFVICNSMVKHDNATGEYNTRRRECEEGVAALQERFPEIRALRDATLDHLEAIRGDVSDTIYRRCRHVVTEDERTQRARWALERGDVVKLGALMDASHASMRDDYEITCAEIDTMVALARLLPGVFGARMTGGGFGGCTVNLVANGDVESFVATMKRGYHEGAAGVGA